jgi:hypothetical protein
MLLIGWRNMPMNIRLDAEPHAYNISILDAGPLPRKQGKRKGGPTE